MSLEAVSFQENGLHIVALVHKAKGHAIRILPDYGALWHGWRIPYAGGTIDLIDHYVDSSDLEQHFDASFKSARLSPFACRIPEGHYSFDGVDYALQPNRDANAIHGMLYNKPFRQEGVTQDAGQISVKFAYAYRHEDNGYPFDYDCTVQYTLHKNYRVTIETEIHNRDHQIIPVMDGWHPYFTTGNLVDDCKLGFTANQIVEFDDQLIPTGRMLPYSHFIQERHLGNIQLDNSFISAKGIPQNICTFFDPKKNIRLHIYPDESYPILQLYIPPHRRSIAIETLSGAPNAFNNGIGLIRLSPGERKVFSASFEVTTG